MIKILSLISEDGGEGIHGAFKDRQRLLINLTNIVVN